MNQPLMRPRDSRGRDVIAAGNTYSVLLFESNLGESLQVSKTVSILGESLQASDISSIRDESLQASNSGSIRGGPWQSSDWVFGRPRRAVASSPSLAWPSFRQVGEEGNCAIVQVAPPPVLTPVEREATRKATLWEVLESLSGSIEGPKDWAAEADHYLYGQPKRG